MPLQCILCIMLIQSTMYNVFILIYHITQLQYHLSLIFLLTLHVIQISFLHTINTKLHTGIIQIFHNPCKQLSP